MLKLTARHFSNKPSRQLLYWLIASHLFAIGILLFIAIAWWAKIIFIIVVVIGFVWVLLKNGWINSDKFIAGIYIDSSRCWQLIYGDQKTVGITLLGESMVTPWLITLRYRSPDYRFSQTLTLFPDSMSEKEFRQLRVYLRMEA